MTIRFPVRTGLFCLVTTATLLTGCSSTGDKADRADNPFRTNVTPGGPRSPQSEKELRLEADKAYAKAHEALNTADYATAITRYTSLIARYPFSDYATQAELEKIFAQYRSFQADEAGTAADRFQREHPRHPNADYVQYIKGLVDFERDSGGIIDYLPLDSSKRDVTNARRAYDDFALLIQKYPTSRYAGDARKRMIYLRNRIARHEYSVADYYTRRGAWVAAAKRAEAIIAEYPGAPATADALILLQQCYIKLGQKQQAEEIAQLIAANAASLRAARAPTQTPVTRSVVSTSTPDTVAVVPVVATERAPRPGFFGRIVDLFDGGLDHTYIIGNAVPSQPSDEPRPPSLATGPSSGPDTVVVIPTGGATTAPAQDSSASAAPAPAAVAPTAAAITPPAEAPPAVGTPATAATEAKTAAQKPKSSFWSLEFLNKTYRLGDDKTTPTADPAAAAAPASSSSTAPAPAADKGNIHVTLDYDDEEAKQKAADDAAKAKAAADAAAAAPAPAQ